MEPISAVASVIAMYELTLKIGKTCFLYAKGVRDSDKGSDYVIEEIVNFQRSLVKLKRMLIDEEDVKSNGHRQKNLKDLIEGETAGLRQCKIDLEIFHKKLEKGRTQEGIKALIHKISWPLKEEEVREVTDRLRNVAASIDRALLMDQTEMIREGLKTQKQMASSLERTEDSQRMKDEERKKETDQRKAEETRDKIMQWLTHPNPAENHNVACHARNEKAKTGRWFLDGDAFKEFRDTPRSLLFLHGDSGCGKTILCSAIIEELCALRNGGAQIDIAFWYYYANIKTRTTLNNLVRALISQFIPPSSIPPTLVEFWNAKNKGLETPKDSDLVQTLQKILIERANRESYIVIDALDESDENEWDELMEMIRNILSAENAGIRILVTSRTNTARIGNDLNELKELTRFYNVTIESEIVNSDILAHITERLQNDKTLRAWPEKERENVKKALLEKAAGMFRWVDCQLQAIRKCKTPADLKKTLDTLPKDVHEQYARELAGITDNTQSALKILQWLTFPQRKLRVEEATDMIAVDLDQDPPVFDEEKKMWNSEGVLEICGSLVRADVNPGRNSLGEFISETQTLTTAHATVLDFLKTQPIRIGSDPGFRFTKSKANLRMAETCLVYLRFFVDNHIELTEENVVQYPFARLSAEFWDDYYREIVANGQEEVDMTRCNAMVMDLFQSPDAMLKWIRLCDPDDDTSPVNFEKKLSEVHPPLYYAALLGLPEIAKRFIDQGAEINVAFRHSYGTPLVAASVLGRKEIVSLLLDRGADPKLSGWWYWGCPLAGAVEKNQVEIVKMLLHHKDIDINCRRIPPESKGEFSITAEANLNKNEAENIAKERVGEIEDEKDTTGYEAAVKERNPGEDSKGDAEGDSDQLHYDEILSRSESMVYIAAAYNSPEVLKILLDEGADPNIEGGLNQTALQAACYYAYEDIVKTLLERDVKVDIHGGQFGSALIAACYFDSTEIVAKLIAKGSDINYVSEGNHGSALYAACMRQREDVVELLLKKGADMNTYGSSLHSPLQVACFAGNTAIAKRLLDAGGDVNQKGGEDGSLLSSACNQGKNDLVRLLLDNGAHINTQECGRCDNALQQACEKGDEEIVHMLLEKGANPNLHGGHYGDALQAGCISGNESIVGMLLKSGAGMGFRGGYFETPLQAAVCSGSEEIVKLLLDSGASVNEKGGAFSYPLLRASACPPSHDPVLKILLENGANPNLEREEDDKLALWYRTALQNARSVSMTTMLLDRGALLNTQSGYFGTALHSAVGGEPVDRLDSKELEIVRLLIGRGADVNAPHWQHGTPLVAACGSSRLEHVKLLLEKGSQLHSYNLIGQSPIQVAICKSRWDVFNHLIDLGCDPTLPDKRGCTGLHYAARGRNNDDSVRRILEYGLDINGVDSNGWSALHWAAASGYRTAKVIKTLLQAGINKDLKDNQGRTALDLSIAFEKYEEAAILKAEEKVFLDLPETENEETWVEGRWFCDGCRDGRGDGGPECAFHCKTCIEFDLCFRCILDKDTIHHPGHEFIAGYRYPRDSLSQVER